MNHELAGTTGYLVCKRHMNVTLEQALRFGRAKGNNSKEHREKLNKGYLAMFVGS